MKFDHVIMNPPYNDDRHRPVWTGFVTAAMASVVPGGAVVAVHPDAWRLSSRFKKTKAAIRNGLVRLVQLGATGFRDVAVTTDWYLWRDGHDGPVEVSHLADGDETVATGDEVYSVRRDHPAVAFLNQVCTPEHNNGLKQGKGWSDAYKTSTRKLGPHKAIGGQGMNTSWCHVKGDGITPQEPVYTMCDAPQPGHDVDKVVASYVGRPRAAYVPASAGIGVVRGHWWPVSGIGVVCGNWWHVTGSEQGEALAAMLNSPEFWDCVTALFDIRHGHANSIPSSMLRSIDLAKVTALYGKTPVAP